jgi:hypothetical protein
MKNVRSFLLSCLLSSNSLFAASYSFYSENYPTRFPGSENDWISSTRFRIQTQASLTTRLFGQVGSEFSNPQAYTYSYFGLGGILFLDRDIPWISVYAEIRNRMYHDVLMKGRVAPTSTWDPRLYLVLNPFWSEKLDFNESFQPYFELYSEWVYSALNPAQMTEVSWVHYGYRTYSNDKHSIDAVIEVRLEKTWLVPSSPSWYFRPGLRYQFRPIPNINANLFGFMDGDLLQSSFKPSGLLSIGAEF